VRYAAIPKSPGEPVYAYAKADYQLKSDFPELKEAAYTLRALRPGYVYVWMDSPEGEKLSIHEHDGEGGYRALRYLGQKTTTRAMPIKRIGLPLLFGRMLARRKSG
jgi:hypothetical protein